jgi:hypothetical protein
MPDLINQLIVAAACMQSDPKLTRLKSVRIMHYTESTKKENFSKKPHLDRDSLIILSSLDNNKNTETGTLIFPQNAKEFIKELIKKTDNRFFKFMKEQAIQMGPENADHYWDFVNDFPMPTILKIDTVQARPEVAEQMEAWRAESYLIHSERGRYLVFDPSSYLHMPINPEDESRCMLRTSLVREMSIDGR